MSGLAQKILFRKVKSLFLRGTGNIPPAMKKKYRLPEERLKELRNIVCLFAQIHPHLETRLALADAKQWETEMSETALKDEDMKYIVEMCPKRFALINAPVLQERRAGTGRRARAEDLPGGGEATDGCGGCAVEVLPVSP